MRVDGIIVTGKRMSTNIPAAAKKELVWTPALVRMLRGKRSLSDFGRLIGVPKNTAWRWEAGMTTPHAKYACRLTALATQESFLADWQIVGSIIEVQEDLEAASQQILETISTSLDKTALSLTSQDNAR